MLYVCSMRIGVARTVPESVASVLVHSPLHPLQAVPVEWVCAKAVAVYHTA